MLKVIELWFISFENIIYYINNNVKFTLNLIYTYLDQNTLLNNNRNISKTLWCLVGH